MSISSAKSVSVVVHLITDIEDLFCFSDAWAALVAKRANPAEHMIWHEAAAVTCFSSGSGPLRLVEVRRYDKITALALMQIGKKGLSKFISHIGSDYISEPVDIAYESDDDVKVLLKFLPSLGFPVMFARLPSYSRVLVLEPSVKGRFGASRTIQKPNYPTLDLNESPAGNLNSGRRSDLRRMRRKANEAGGWRSEVINPTVDEVSEYLRIAAEIEAKSWKVDSGYALRERPKMYQFYSEYLRRAAASNSVRFAFGYIGGDAVAMQIAISSGGGFWLLKIGYDARVAGVAPGQLLMQDTIEYSVKMGLSSYEFYGNAAEWTTMWTKLENASFRVEMYPLCINSILYILTIGVAKMWGEIRSKFSQWSAQRGNY